MFTQRYVLVVQFEDEDDPECSYYDFDELDKALKEFEKTRGFLEVRIIDQFTGKTVRQMEACEYTLPVQNNPYDPADWWKPTGWKL